MNAKSLLLSVVILCGFYVANLAAAEAPDGFAGIAWGTNKDAATQEMLKKPGVEAMRGDTPGRVSFSGGKFGDQPARVWGLEFTSDNRLTRGAVVLKASAERDRGFNAVKQMISAKYGPATSNSKKGDDVKALWKSRTNPNLIIELWNNPGGDGPKVTYRNDGLETAPAGSKRDI